MVVGGHDDNTTQQQCGAEFLCQQNQTKCFLLPNPSQQQHRSRHRHRDHGHRPIDPLTSFRRNPPAKTRPGIAHFLFLRDQK